MKLTSREMLKALLPECEEALHSVDKVSVVTPSVAKLLGTTVPALVGRLADLRRA